MHSVDRRNVQVGTYCGQICELRVDELPFSLWSAVYTVSLWNFKGIVMFHGKSQYLNTLTRVPIATSTRFLTLGKLSWPLEGLHCDLLWMLWIPTKLSGNFDVTWGLLLQKPFAHLIHTVLCSSNVIKAISLEDSARDSALLPRLVRLGAKGRHWDHVSPVGTRSASRKMARVQRSMDTQSCVTGHTC